METLLTLITTSVILFLTDHQGDPSFDFWKGRQEIRDLECERMSQAQAHELHPGKVPPPAPRMETFMKVDALVCTPRIVPAGEQPPRDEVILTTLGERVGQLTRAATASVSNVSRWYADAYYPNITISSRIALAARTDLAENGAPVSNAVPLLAAGDLLVLRSLPVSRAFPLACIRAFEEGALAADEALLSIVLVDERSTELHGGVCHQGRWRWLS